MMSPGKLLPLLAGFVFQVTCILAALDVDAQELSLPSRPSTALTGGQLAERVALLDLPAREQEVYSQVMAGNVPKFLRRLRPVQVTNVFEGKTNTATFYATPDYFAIGSDADYLLMPVSPGTAQRIADELGCCLPTRKMVDAIYAAADVKLAPVPIPPSAAMTSVAVFSNHNAIVHAQREDEFAAHPLGALVAGHKKDVVISAQLAGNPGRVAIYGWHKTNGVAIQPLFLGHTANWVDYSQCTRLVQETMLVNGTNTTVSAVLADAALAGLLSDEGTLPNARYEAAALTWATNEVFHERNAWLSLRPGVRVMVNEPVAERFPAGRKVQLVFYALPNGNTIEQTVGREVKPGDDWHFGIQHIGAQTRFLRNLLKNRELVVAYLENDLKNWPAWRKRNGDRGIPEILSAIERRLGCTNAEIVLSGHSGGGSLIFGYLYAMEAIPDRVVRIAFLDSNYAYDRAAHRDKLVNWLNARADHCLCVLAYNDAVALLDGKPFVSATGGTWGKSHEMQRDLAEVLAFTDSTNAGMERFSALTGRAQFILKENPERKILHTVQVERNGFIHALLTGTSDENRGYEYFGPRAYEAWIEKN